MPKRNFSDFAENRDPTPEERAFYLQKTRLFQQFEYGVVTLSKAMKVARGFERQKLSRREKTAKSTEGKEGTLGRLAEEVEFTKTFDPVKVAENYLFRQLVKTKRIAESPVFIKFKESKRMSAEGPKTPAEANVTARLYKSTPVKNVFPGIMDGIRKLLGVENKPVPADAKGAKKKGAEKDGKTKEKGAAVAEKKEKKDGEKRTTVSGEPEAEQSGDEEDVDMDDADADSIDFAQFDARLASGSEDEDGEERADDRDISDSDDDDDEAEERIHSHHSDISISRSPSPEQSDSPPAKKAKGSKKASSAPATSTTFLPSLSMGGYWSGSESEAEDIAANEPPKRKNRMGQQARRALWEKKYGSGANHVKQEMGKRGRDNGWDARRGATGGGDRWGRQGGNQGWGRPQQQNGRPQRGPPAKPQDNKPLHPSWEAAKKAKEQKNTASFQGKKVVFD